MLDIFCIIFLLSLATSSISMTIAESKTCEKMRSFVAKKNEWLGNLVNCPYCLSHWVSLGLVLVFSPLPGFWGVIVATFAIVTLASFWSIGIYRLFEKLESK